MSLLIFTRVNFQENALFVVLDSIIRPYKVPIFQSSEITFIYYYFIYLLLLLQNRLLQKQRRCSTFTLVFISLSSVTKKYVQIIFLIAHTN